VFLIRFEACGINSPRRRTFDLAKLKKSIPISANVCRTLGYQAETGRADDTQLPADCCDGIFLREVYHHLTNPAAMDRSLYRSVRPDGRLAIIDFEPLPGTRPPAGVPANRRGHGAPKRTVEQELTAAGFELLKTIDWPISSTVKHYCILFRKRSGDVGADISQSRGSLSALALFAARKRSGQSRVLQPARRDARPQL
jgi:SAM-dependent methyltransferase